MELMGHSQDPHDIVQLQLRVQESRYKQGKIINSAMGNLQRLAKSGASLQQQDYLRRQRGN
jgi:hypothetical protein